MACSVACSLLRQWAARYLTEVWFSDYGGLCGASCKSRVCRYIAQCSVRRGITTGHVK